MLDRWYIAGPMTGWFRHNFGAFMQAELIVGPWARCIFNPARADMQEGYDGFGPAPRTWQEYMVRDMKEMFGTDVLVLLPLWSVSEGAKQELEVYESLWPRYRTVVCLDDTLSHIACVSIERSDANG